MLHRPWKYKHLEHLSFEDYPNATIRSLVLFAYNVNIECNVPFVQYLFVTEENKEHLHLPTFDVSLNCLKCPQIRKLCVERLLSILHDSSIDDLSMDDFIFNGFEIHGDSVHVFFDISNYKTQLHTPINNIQFCLMDEIVNTCYCFNSAISESDSLHFRTHATLIYLSDDNGSNYEIPIAGYVHSHTNLVVFDYSFGIRRSDSLALLGPYYYFTDYSNIKRTSLHLVDKGGIIRFALMIGSMLVKLNYPNDPIDVSDIKMKRLEDDILERKYECLTMRISDNGGIWNEMYDSVFVGKVELDDGSFLRDAPFIAMKQKEQFVALNYQIHL